MIGNSAIGALEGCSSYSDPITGDLLFYTNGTTVWDKNQNPMLGSITTPMIGGLSSTQGALIVPVVGTTNKYYIFCNGEEGSGFLAYNIVDLSLNSGLGDVIVSNTILLENSTEKLCGIGNCNGSEFWVASHKYDTDSFFLFKVDSIINVIYNCG